MGGMESRRAKHEYRFQVLPSDENPDRMDLAIGVTEEQVVKFSVQFCGSFAGHKLSIGDHWLMKLLGLKKDGVGTLRCSIDRLGRGYHAKEFKFNCFPRYSRHTKKGEPYIAEISGKADYWLVARKAPGDKPEIHGWITVTMITDYQ